MKALFEEKPSTDYATSSGESKDDQEMGSTAMSETGSVLKNSPFLCFPNGIDQNYGRGVSKCLRTWTVLTRNSISLTLLTISFLIMCIRLLW